MMNSVVPELYASPVRIVNLSDRCVGSEASISTHLPGSSMSLYLPAC